MTDNTQPAAEKDPDLYGELVQKIRRLEDRVKTLRNDMHRRQIYYTNHELRDQALLEKKEADKRHLENAYKQLALEYKEKCQEIEGMKAEHPALHFYVKKVEKTFAEASTQTEERKEEDIGGIDSSSDNEEESEEESDRDGEEDSEGDNTDDELIVFKGRCVQQDIDIIVFKGRRNEEDTEDILLFRGRRSLV